MARDHDRDRILAAGAADRAGYRADRGGQIAVALGLAIGDFLHRRPYLTLAIRAGGPQRQVEIGQLTGEIAVELARRLSQQWTAVRGALTGPADRGDGI